MQRYSKLTVWVEAHAIAKRIYFATEGFPRREWFGLGSQLRRAAFSIASNIAEGSRRATDKDFAHFINIAETSATEVEYGVLFCADVGLIESVAAQEIFGLLESLFRRLAALRRRLLEAAHETSRRRKAV